MDAVGIDEFGREHFVVDAAPGRLCMTLGETETGAVVVRGHKELTSEMLVAWDDADRKRLLRMREVVAVGDRLVAIEGDDVVHCSLSEVSARLGKLAAKTRRLTFARYYASPFDGTPFDVEKLVLVHAPRGPLGLRMSESWRHGAVVDGFQPLPDGSTSKLARDPRIHCGCRIVRVNGRDVSTATRDEAVETLAALKDDEKELIVYRAAPATCYALLQVELSAADAAVSDIVFDDAETCKCVVVAAPGTPSLQPGDVLASVNGVDVTWMRRVDALDVLRAAVWPRVLHLYRVAVAALPECQRLCIESGPLGLHLDSSRPDCAAITGFTNAADAAQPAFASCAAFVPGSRIVAINQLSVVHESLAAVTTLLVKLSGARKDILLANEPLARALQRREPLTRVHVAPGPLGVHFDSAQPDEARVAGFYALSDGQPGDLERSGRVVVGALLIGINGLNVSCLTLAQVTALLQKLRDAPKELELCASDSDAASAKVVHVRVPPGPLGLSLKSSISNKVIVERLNADPALGPTFVRDHGGVVPGSQVLAIDGLSVAALELADVTQLLRTLAAAAKTITFSTTAAAYAAMVSVPRTDSSRRSVEVTRSPLGIAFDPTETQRAIVCAFDAAATELSEHDVPIGSRLVAIDDVDVRALDVAQIARVLQDLAASPKTLVFDTPCAPLIAEAGDSASTQVRFNVPATASSRSELSVPSPLQRRDTADAVPDSGAMQTPPQQSDSMSHAPAPIAVPAPLQLASLSIKPLEVLKSMALTDSSKTLDQKPLQQQVTSTPPKTEFMINMASWTGSRSLFRLTVDIAGASLQIVSAKAPTSPRVGSKSSGTTVLFSDITSLGFGKKGENTSSSGSAPLAIGVVKSKKPIEFDMRSREERQELCALLTTLVPALNSSSDNSSTE